MRTKLTQDVFIYRPVWAEWAAVDSNGCAYWYSSMPTCRATYWSVSSSSRACCMFGVFDSTDWKNSLIKRQKESK